MSFSLNPQSNNATSRERSDKKVRIYEFTSEFCSALLPALISTLRTLARVNRLTMARLSSVALALMLALCSVLFVAQPVRAHSGGAMSPSAASWLDSHCDFTPAEKNLYKAKARTRSGHDNIIPLTECMLIKQYLLYKAEKEAIIVKHCNVTLDEIKAYEDKKKYKGDARNRTKRGHLGSFPHNPTGKYASPPSS